MTTTIKKTAKKTIKRPGRKKTHSLPLPPSASTATIAGTDYVIIPANEYEEWCEDMLLGVLAAERLAKDEELIPLEEVERRLDAKKKKRS